MANLPKPERAKRKPKRITTDAPPGGTQTPGAKMTEAAAKRLLERMEKDRAKRDKAVNRLKRK